MHEVARLGRLLMRVSRRRSGEEKREKFLEIRDGGYNLIQFDLFLVHHLTVSNGFCIVLFGLLSFGG